MNDLIVKGDEPIAFDSDCREGICGMCGQVVNGVPHGPQEKTTVCQLHMRHFKDGDTIYIEPFRARAFPVIKDLIVDRGAFDRIIQAGGYISVHTGGVPDGNAILIPKHDADIAMDAAECIGCGACVAACPNGSAMLFTSAKVTHLAMLPQGRVEAARRVCVMTEEMLEPGFRQLQQSLRMSGRLSKGHQGEVHRQTEPGIHQGTDARYGCHVVDLRNHGKAPADLSSITEGA